MTERDVYVSEDRRVSQLHTVFGSNQVGICLHVRDYSFPEGASATAYAEGTGGDVYSTPCEISGNDVSFLPPEGFFQPGRNRLQVEVTTSGGAIITFHLDVDCDTRLAHGKQAIPLEKQAAWS